MATILLVDDVELFLELERSFLDGTGHEILTATSAAAALATIERCKPDLILLDLFMPDMDGDELCRRLRASEEWRSIRVVMVTAAGKDEQVQRCLEAGCDDFITKPVGKTELLEKVNRLLGYVRGRTARRAPVALKVSIQGEGRSLEAQVQDLSVNGLFARSDALLHEGTAVQLQLALPNGQSLALMGKVARLQEGAAPGMGIYLVHPQPEDQREIEQLIELEEQTKHAISGGQPDVSVEGRMNLIERHNAALGAELAHLRQRIVELEEENLAFAQQIVQTDDVNNNLTNLYIASSRLHSVLNRNQVLEIIREVIINFIGAEKFAILMFRKESAELHFEIGEGFADGEYPSIRQGSGILWDVIQSESPFFQEGSVVAGSDDPFQPIAAIPLKIHGTTMGMLAIYRLFTQKESFQPVDFQLFSMMAEHAVTALFSSTLYEQSERKRETYKGFMDLLLR